MYRRLVNYIVVLGIFVAMACQETSHKDLAKMKPYQGAMITTYNLKTNFSDSGKVRIRLEAPLQEEFQDGTQEFNKGVVINFFDKFNQNYAQLTANKGKFHKIKNQYTATGNVVVQNLKENKKMNTEELHWTPNNQQIFTDKFVTITTPDEILKGEGLTAKQDFSSYKILKPTGSFNIKKQAKKNQ